MRRALVLALIAVTACSKRPEARMQNADTLTQRQRDSVVGASGLPGARGISKAQAAQDSANARTARTDSAARDSSF